MSTFSSQDIPDLHDQVIIVTGGNVGLGYKTVCQLSLHNPARVYLAARLKDKATMTIKDLQETNLGVADVQFL
jgi:NAD(P)-dependent dehydrogenase (short-subunit alcohol dehydrogenase family)